MRLDDSVALVGGENDEKGARGARYRADFLAADNLCHETEPGRADPGARTSVGVASGVRNVIGFSRA